MSFKTDNTWYIIDFAKKLSSLSGAEKKVYLEEQKKEVSRRLLEGSRKYKGTSKFYFDYLETFGKIEQYQKQYAINFYLDSSSNLGPIYQFIRQGDVPINDSLLKELASKGNPEDVLISYFKSKLQLPFTEIKDLISKPSLSHGNRVGNKTVVGHSQVLRRAIDFLGSLLLYENKIQEVNEFIVHFTKLWGLYKVNNVQINTTYIVVLNHLNQTIENSLDKIKVDVINIIAEIKDLLLDSEITSPIMIITDENIDSQGCKKQIERYKDNLIMVNELLDNKIPISHLLKRYSSLLKANGHSLSNANNPLAYHYLHVIKRRLQRLDKASAIKQLGLNFIKCKTSA